MSDGAIISLLAAAYFLGVLYGDSRRRPQPPRRTRAQHPGRVTPRDCTPVHKALTDPIDQQVN